MTPSPSPYRRIPAGRHGLTAADVHADQVARIHAAMLQAVAESGYGPVTVEQIIGVANVSRRAFYAEFADKQSCLLATLDVVLGEWRERLPVAFSTHGGEMGGDPQTAVHAALRALFEQIRADPLGARVLFIEAAAVGPAGQARIAEIFEQLLTLTTGLLRGASSDRAVSPRVAGGVVGGVVEMIAVRVLSGHEQDLPELLDSLTSWAVGYASAEALSILGSIKPSAQPDGPPADLGIPALGRSGLWHAESQRSAPLPEDAESRILEAVVKISGADSYLALSINRIVTEARVSQRTFRAFYPSAHAAFMAAFAAAGREMMTSCLPMVFAAKDWASSVVAGLMAHTGWLADHPKVARFGFLPVLSAGPDGVRLRRKELEAWSAAMQPGFRMPDAPPLVYGEAIAGAIYRLQQHVIVTEGPAALRDLAGPLAYITLEPFYGPLPTAKLIRDHFEGLDA